MSIGATKLQTQPQLNSSVHQVNSIGPIMASQHSGGTATSVAQQNNQGVTQQQLQLQQPTTTATLQGNHQAGNHVQPLQVIQQPLQNQLMQHQFYNTQGQLLMPGNLFHPGLNPQLQQAQIAPSIQVIAAGKTLQPNQLSAPHLFTQTSYTIPTSASNNQAYIIGQLNSHPSILQQQQTTKPGEMQKVIQPQIGATTQIPAQTTMWAIPQFLNQNPILIRGTQPDQMFIQQQQPLHNNTSTHQHFTTMPLTSQLPATSISSATTNGVQQVTQQQAQIQQQAQNQQSQQGQSQAQPQIATSNIVSIKAPATLQPKPPLQIQPQPPQGANQNQHQSQQNQQQQAQQQAQQLQQQTQQLSQLQQVTMAHQSQVQMINQAGATSQQGMLSQQILAQTQQLTAQVMQQTQGLQQAPRQLTILPQNPTQQIQPQPVTLIQQSQQQHTTLQPQPIRPNYSTASTGSPSTTQSQGIVTSAPQQRAKMRKPNVGRGNTNASPTQQAKTVFPRPAIPATISPLPTQQQLKPAPAPGATLTKVPIPQQGPTSQSSPVGNQPLKTINIAALHTPTPNLPDATLTPLMPQATSQTQQLQQPPPPQPIQVYPTTTTQLPSPNISITPAPPPMKKEDPSNDNVSSHQSQPPQQPQQNSNQQSQPHNESKSENEKENTKADNTSEDSEEGSGKQKLPKAMVKPQVLTHVIEGFVIQEASEPFPLGRNADSDEPPLKKVALAGEMGKCEMCGKVDLRSKFKKNKRVCSSQCAKGMKAQQQQMPQPPPSNAPDNSSQVNNINENRLKLKGKRSAEGGESEFMDETSSSVGEPSLMSPTNEHVDEEPKVNPVKWNVLEVVDFVRSLPGCAEYAEDFAVQEIDGQALMLLKEDHLMSAMGMKLGPALKLCAKIEVIKAGLTSANGECSQSKQ